MINQLKINTNTTFNITVIKNNMVYYDVKK